MLFIFILLFCILKLHALNCFHGLSFDCFLVYLHPIGEHLAVSAVHLGNTAAVSIQAGIFPCVNYVGGLSVSTSGLTALKGTW